MECMELSWNFFPLPLDSMYVRRFLNNDTKTDAVELVNSIKEEMYKTLSYVDWMDDETRYSLMVQVNNYYFVC